MITDGTLHIVGVTWRQYGTFTCIAANTAGQGTKTMVLTVRRKYQVQY